MGNKVKTELGKNPKYYYFRDYLNSINLKKVIIGTIDSISEDILRNDLEGIDYTIIEDFIANSLMIR